MKLTAVLLTLHQSKVLDELTAAGTKGLNSFSEFRKDNALQISGTVRQLKDKGYIINSRHNRDRSVTYFLLHTPQQLRDRPVVQPVRVTSQEPPAPVKSTEELEEDYQALRLEWVEARDAGASQIDLDVIKSRGLAIKRALEMRYSKQRQLSLAS